MSAYQDLLFLVNVRQLASTTTTTAPPLTQLHLQQPFTDPESHVLDTYSSQRPLDVSISSGSTGEMLQKSPNTGQLSSAEETTGPLPSSEQDDSVWQREPHAGETREFTSPRNVVAGGNTGLLPSVEGPVEEIELQLSQLKPGHTNSRNQAAQQAPQEEQRIPPNGSDNQLNTNRPTGLLPSAVTSEVRPRPSESSSEESWATRRGMLPRRRLLGSPSSGSAAALEVSAQLRGLQTETAKEETADQFHTRLPIMNSSKGGRPQRDPHPSDRKQEHTRPVPAPSRRRLGTAMRPQDTGLSANSGDEGASVASRPADFPSAEHLMASGGSSTWPSPAPEQNASSAAPSGQPSSPAAASAMILGILRSVETFVAEKCGPLCLGMRGEPVYAFPEDQQGGENVDIDGRQTLMSVLPEVCSIPVRVSCHQGGWTG